MARTSLAALIAQTRILINDSSDSPVFSDEAVQDALDRRRVEQRHVPLQPGPTFAPGGAVIYSDFYANIGAWEDDTDLQDVAYNHLTATIAEPAVGHWHFDTPPAGFAVRATGKTYDLYGSASDLLEAWAARVTLDFDFQDGQSQYQRSQKGTALRALAADYRQRALVQTTMASQVEFNDTSAGPAVTYPTSGQDWF